jgi:hypothetical protein
MSRFSTATASIVVLAGFLALPVPAPAWSFSGPFFPEEEEYPPGVTIAGSGLARVAAPDRLGERSIDAAVEAARPRAVSRAVKDARRSAKSIAGALGVTLGDVEAIELGDAFAERSRHCRRARRGRPARCRVPDFTGATATVTFAIEGGAEPADGDGEVTGAAATSVAVEPEDPERSSAIRFALRGARAAALPRAARNAKRNVATAARAAGLSLGPIVSIVEEQNPYGYGPILGAFAPGTFCGLVRSARVRVDPETGLRRVIRGERRRRCFFPRTLEVSLEATFLAE